MLSKTRSPAPTSPMRKYDRNASIALVGIRGTGLSTLAVMAASALGFRIIDSDQNFYLVTGLSRAEYRATHGATSYRKEEMRLMRAMLDNTSRHVIVCGPGAVEATGQDLLAQFSQTHPVIYVTRDAAGIQQHLGVGDIGRILGLLRQCAPIFRSLSAFEFHNLSDLAGRDMGDTHSSGGRCSPRSLALKRVEHDFVHLLRFITDGQDGVPGSHLRLGLPRDPAQAQHYTYALSLPISVSQEFLSEISEVDVLSDAVELTIPWPGVSTDSETPHRLTVSAADYITRQYYAVRRNVRLPIIFNLQLAHSNGSLMSRVDMEGYFEVLHHGLRLGPELLTVNLESDDDLIRDLVAAKGRTKIIAHHSDSTSSQQLGWDDPDLLSAVRKAESLDADIVRLTRPAKSTADNIAVRHFLDQTDASGKFKIPVIAYNTGYAGRMSRYLNPMLSPVTCELSREHSLDDRDSHLLTVREAQVALHASLALDSMYFGIYGNRVSLSLSPDMHNPAFLYSGMPHQYRAMEHDSLRELQSMLEDPHFGGASVTTPFKSDVIVLVDSMSPEARAIGAVNTIIPLRSTGSSQSHRAVTVYGENTDWIGIHTCVRQNLSPINAVKRRTTALVVGAGGMARATMYALIRMGVRSIAIHNRTESRAHAVADHFQGKESVGDGSDVSGQTSREGSVSAARTSPVIRVIPNKSDAWPEDMDYPTIIVSCIPTRNVEGKASPDTTLPANWLSSPTGGVVIELSYTPLESELLKQVRTMGDQGWIAVDGLQVLPEQGKMQFELFTNRRAPIRLMRKAVVDGYHTRGIS